MELLPPLSFRGCFSAALAGKFLRIGRVQHRLIAQEISPTIPTSAAIQITVATGL